jgi:uncharacterized metal-binding protein
MIAVERPVNALDGALIWGARASVNPMPAGRVHNVINTVSFLAFTGAYAYAYSGGLVAFAPLAAAAFTGAFFAGTFLLSPDLDLAEGHVSSKRAWGPLGFLWVPYGWLMSHRGLSHTWVVGPFTRLAYLAALLALPAYLLREQVLAWHPDSAAALWALVGFYVSQWLHLIADGVMPDLERPAFLPRARRRR